MHTHTNVILKRSTFFAILPVSILRSSHLCNVMGVMKIRTRIACLEATVTAVFFVLLIGEETRATWRAATGAFEVLSWDGKDIEGKEKAWRTDEMEESENREESQVNEKKNLLQCTFSRQHKWTLQIKQIKRSSCKATVRPKMKMFHVVSNVYLNKNRN